jgi:hypothetical protein
MSRSRWTVVMLTAGLALGCAKGGLPAAFAGDGGRTIAPARGDGGAISCDPLDYPSPTSRYTCSAQLRSCLASSASPDSCLSAESAACDECLTDSYLHCATGAGCDDELGLYDCCLRAACPTSEPTCLDSAASTGPCVAPLAAIRDCAASTGCGGVPDECVAGSGSACSQDGLACTSSLDCCSGTCAYDSYLSATVCGGSGGACQSAGAYCFDDTDCCSGYCGPSGVCE